MKWVVCSDFVAGRFSAREKRDMNYNNQNCLVTEYAIREAAEADADDLRKTWARQARLRQRQLDWVRFGQYAGHPYPRQDGRHGP